MEVGRQGANQMRMVGRALKDMGDRAMTREFNRALTKAVQPLKGDLPASARGTLPRRGGLAERVAVSPIRVARRANGGVRVTARNQYQITKMDDPGLVRHKVFDRPGVKTRWVAQKVTPGWFTRPATARRPQAQREMLDACKQLVQDIDAAARRAA